MIHCSIANNGFSIGAIEWYGSRDRLDASEYSMSLKDQHLHVQLDTLYHGMTKITETKSLNYHSTVITEMTRTRIIFSLETHKWFPFIFTKHPSHVHLEYCFRTFILFYLPPRIQCSQVHRVCQHTWGTASWWPEDQVPGNPSPGEK